MSQMSEGRDNVAVQIECLVNHLHNPTQSKPMIFKVDDCLRQVNAEDYEPDILAIGPIHHGKDRLKNMEQHKVWYLKQLLQRRSGELSIEKFVIKLRQMEEKASQYYSKSVLRHQDEFVKMLLLDGCFVIELIRKYLFHEWRDDNDHIFQFDHTIGQIRHDLMLFENQLPFFVLNELFNMTKTADPEDNICFLVRFFVDGTFPWLNASKVDSNSDILLNADHLLGLVYQSYFPFSNMHVSETKGKKGNDLVHINSASELKEAGIQLKGSKEISPLDVTFEDGVIKLPMLNVSDKTESMLRNLMAYELCFSNNHPKYVTDYAFFMHCLINSTKDIEILRRRGIMNNLLGGDDLICGIFNRLGKNVFRSSDFRYADVFQCVNKHCSLRHNTWMAKLKRNYFNSPWAIVSFLAAAILLLLTFTQAVFSVLSYRK